MSKNVLSTLILTEIDAHLLNTIQYSQGILQRFKDQKSVKIALITKILNLIQET